MLKDCPLGTGQTTVFIPWRCNAGCDCTKAIQGEHKACSNFHWNTLVHSNYSQLTIRANRTTFLTRSHSDCFPGLSGRLFSSGSCPSPRGHRDLKPDNPRPVPLEHTTEMEGHINILPRLRMYKFLRIHNHFWLIHAFHISDKNWFYWCSWLAKTCKTMMIWWFYVFFLGFKHKKQTMWCHHQSLSISAILAASFHWSRSPYLEAILRSLRFAHFTVGATTTSSTPIPRRPARFSCGQNWRHWTFATCVTLCYIARL